MFGRRTHELRRELDTLRSALDVRLAEVVAGRYSSTVTVASLPVTCAARAMIADVAASLPLVAVRDGAPVMPTPSLLVRPDPRMTRRRWVHRAAMSLTGDGNLYALALRIGSNDWPLSAEVLPPEQVAPITDPLAPWHVSGWTYAGGRYSPDEITHVPLWEFDLASPVCHGPLRHCQGAFDDLATLWAFAAAYWSEGGKPPYALKHPSRMSPKQARDQLAQWVEARRQYRPGLVSGGWELVDLSTPSAQDALLLDGLAYIDQKVAQLYAIPPTLLNIRAESGSLTYTNTRDEVGRWLYLSLGPMWLNRIADAFTLMLPGGQQAVFDTTSLGMGPQPLGEGGPPPPPPPPPASSAAGLIGQVSPARADAGPPPPNLVGSPF